MLKELDSSLQRQVEVRRPRQTHGLTFVAPSVVSNTSFSLSFLWEKGKGCCHLVRAHPCQMHYAILIGVNAWLSNHLVVWCSTILSNIFLASPTNHGRTLTPPLTHTHTHLIKASFTSQKACWAQRANGIG